MRVQPVIDVQRAQLRRGLSCQGGQQNGGVQPAAESNQHISRGVAGHQLGKVLRQRARIEWRSCLYSLLSEKTPNEAILAARAARSSTRGMASS